MGGGYFILKLYEQISIWRWLASCNRPIILYGMGDGGDKIIKVLGQYNLSLSGVFASDGFVRGQSFHGMRVSTLAEITAAFCDPVILLAFATQRGEVLAQIYSLAQKYTLLAPDVPVYGNTIVDEDFIAKYWPQLEKTYSLLADEISRNVFASVLNYKISGKIEYLKQCETNEGELFEDILKLTSTENYVDAGAYNGDTIAKFLHYTQGKYKEILAVEPDKRNFKKLCDNTKHLANIRCENVGVWNSFGSMNFSQTSGRQSCLNPKKAGETVVNSIDNLLATSGSSVTLVKYDVEGAEIQALMGSADTIANHHPKLLVSIYHRSEDIFEIPLLIHSLCPTYKLYMRHQPYIPAWDTNLIAI